MLKKHHYELKFVNYLFDDVSLYFSSYDEIYSFVMSDLFVNNCRYVVSCYDFKKHNYIYNLGGV